MQPGQLADPFLRQHNKLGLRPILSDVIILEEVCQSNIIFFISAEIIGAPQIFHEFILVNGDAFVNTAKLHQNIGSLSIRTGSIISLNIL